MRKNLPRSESLLQKNLAFLNFIFSQNNNFKHDLNDALYEDSTVKNHLKQEEWLQGRKKCFIYEVSNARENPKII